MRRIEKLAVICSVGLAVLGLAACGGDDDKASTTTTGAAAQTVGDCKIQPNTSCPGANLAGAKLAGANLTGATLTGANLTGADLAGATLSDADLTGANLTAAVLTRATLVNTNLSGANLTQANFRGATIQNLKDEGATQCETIRNDGTVNNASCPPPSTVAPVTTPATPATTATTVVPTDLPCTDHPELFLTVFKSQADNFNVPASASESATAVDPPACATDGWATQKISTSGSDLLAVFHATSNGWQLKSITGCAGTDVPQRDQAGIC